MRNLECRALPGHTAGAGIQAQVHLSSKLSRQGVSPLRELEFLCSKAVSTIRVGTPGERTCLHSQIGNSQRAGAVSAWAETSPWGSSYASSISSCIPQCGGCASLIRLRASWGRRQPGASAQTSSKLVLAQPSLPHCTCGVWFAEFGPLCQAQLCTCDRKLVYCLKRNVRSYNPRYQYFPNILC